MPANRPLPKYRHRKRSNQATVRLDGRDFYLGRYDSRESREKYNNLLADWLRNNRKAPTSATGQIAMNPDGFTIAEVCVRYLVHVDKYYRRPDGSPTTEPGTIRQAIRILSERYATTLAEKFGPQALKTVRQAMIEEGWCRKYINKQISRLKSMFKWVKEEWQTAEEEDRDPLPIQLVYDRIRDLRGLSLGRTEARESERVKPVPQAYVDAILPHLSRQVRAMIELQLLTGARPGEICAMRGVEIEQRGKVWTYRPAAHKTAHHGHARQIYLGPRAQEIVREFLRPDLARPLFSPRETLIEWNEQRRRQRKTPMTPSALRRRGRHDPAGVAGDVYNVDAYRRAITRACDAAFPPPPHLAQGEKENRQAWRTRLTPEQRAELRTWRRDHRWHPHQLRHNAATDLRSRYGIEGARIILGHRSAAITEVYAEKDVRTAEKIMGEVG